LTGKGKTTYGLPDIVITLFGVGAGMGKIRDSCEKAKNARALFSGGAGLSGVINQSI